MKNLIGRGEYDYFDGETNKYGVKDFMIGPPDDTQAISVWRGIDDSCYDRAEANAQFITESFNTFIDSGFTPNELLKQRDELLVFVKEMRGRYFKSPWISNEADRLIELTKNQ